MVVVVPCAYRRQPTRLLPPLVCCQAIVDDPDVFESQGFTGGPGSSLADPCLVFDFVVDSQAEIMGTQVSSEPF